MALFPTDCLDEIFENLEGDKITLHSCLLVNRLWCKSSVRILWRDTWSFKYSCNQSLAILSTLIACLPSESKELLHKNRIFISTPTLKPPLFNYAAFCKVLSINNVVQIINNAFENRPPFISLNQIDRNHLISKEIVKMFMNQIRSLKKLTYELLDRSEDGNFYYFIGVPDNITFPEERNFLTDLSELHCDSSLAPEFFRQLSQSCHNLQSLIIYLESEVVPNELKELISLQNNLKNLGLSGDDWSDIITALTKHSNTLTKLHIDGDVNYSSLSFASSFSNLQEIVLRFFTIVEHDYLKELQYSNFPKLKIFKMFNTYQVSPGCIVNFLEINGKNLEEFCTDSDSKDVNSSITRFCPNLRRLFVTLNNGEIDILRDILNSCQYLESIKIQCGKRYLSEKEVFEIVAMYSPRNFYELKIFNHMSIVLHPKDLESFFVSWKNRTLRKPLSLIIIGKHSGLEANDKIIEKYKNLGIIKKFEIKGYSDELEDWQVRVC